MEKARAWLEDEDRNVYILAAGSAMNESIKIHPDARAMFYGFVTGECLRLQKEFETL